MNPIPLGNGTVKIFPNTSVNMIATMMELTVILIYFFCPRRKNSEKQKIMEDRVKLITSFSKIKIIMENNNPKYAIFKFKGEIPSLFDFIFRIALNKDIKSNTKIITIINCGNPAGPIESAERPDVIANDSLKKIPMTSINTT